MAEVTTETPKPQASSDIGSNIKLFGEGLWHGAVENPYNGFAQAVDRFANVLPEMHLTDESAVNSTTAGRAGTVLGTALDIGALTWATGGLGAASYGSAALRMGLVGGGYAGLLQPTDANSSSFWTDRLGNAAIGGATALAGVGTAAALDATGMFAVPAARSLMGSTAYGALTGGGAGLGFAETKALTDGKLAPTVQQLWDTEKTFMTLGAVGGIAGYAFNKATNPRPTEYELDNNRSVKVWSDKSGSPYRIQTRMEEMPGTPFARMESTDNVLNTNGNWVPWQHDLLTKQMYTDVNVAPNGSIDMHASDNHINIDPNGNYRITAPRDSYPEEPFGNMKRVETNAGAVEYDPQGRLISMHPYAQGGFENATWKDTYSGNASYVRYTDAGNIGSVKLVAPSGFDKSPDVTLQAQGSGAYDVTISDHVPFRTTGPFRWNGSVQVVKPQDGGVEQLQFTPQNGQPVTFGIDSKTDTVANLLRPSS